MKPTIELLVVDDEAPILELCRRGIDSAGIKVATADSGAEAVALMAKTEFDIVLSDLHMPPPGGIELARMIAKNHPFTDVIIMTGFETEDSVINAMKLGVYDYLLKPIDLVRLKATLRRCLEKRDLVDTIVAAAHAAGEISSNLDVIAKSSKNPPETVAQAQAAMEDLKAILGKRPKRAA